MVSYKALNTIRKLKDGDLEILFCLCLVKNAFFLMMTIIAVCLKRVQSLRLTVLLDLV